MSTVKNITVALPDKNQQTQTFDVSINWLCPCCGETRGEPMNTTLTVKGKSFDVNFWVNPCGHFDDYNAIVNEAINNGLNNNINKIINILAVND